MSRNINGRQRHMVVKAVAVLSAAALAVGGFGACGSSDSSDAKGHVYFLSDKAEQNDGLKHLFKQFTKDTGISADVTTTSSDRVEQTLKSELAKSEAPTMFEVDNNNFPDWTSYYADMSKTSIYKDLQKPEYAMKSGGKVSAVPYCMERYGIIYNKSLLKKYFDADWSTIKSVDKIDGFDTLKTVVEEIQAHKGDLGVKGAFSSSGFDSSSNKRFGDQLAHIPVYYEYRDQNTTTEPKTVSGKYMPNFKKIFDLYIKNATIAPSQISSATMDDSNSEFALGDAVFLQNGSWAYPDLRGQKVADKDMGVLPIYMGISGEKNAGLTVSFKYLAMNRNASAADKKATERFMDWMLKNKDARRLMTGELGFETPFKSYAKAGFKTKNPIHRANDAYAKAGKYDIVIYPLPSQQWVQTLSGAMMEYGQGTGSWSKVKSAFVDGWASEYKTTHNAK